MLPDKEIPEPTIAEFNPQMKFEIDNIRDFVILHYHVTDRSDSPFWRQCKSLFHKSKYVANSIHFQTKTIFGAKSVLNFR